ncbi:hypothetical protein LCGC14_0568240 [marine sediment metagenome]|uniref:Uncharacterized protein n=1 Tax=marine sediment metagenome TaxID=412755 RepID=A0A0F9S3N4_9ZZZZ
MALQARNYSPALMYGAEQIIKTKLTGDLLELQTADPGAVGPSFDMYHNSPSPANADVVSRQQFYGNDDAGTKVELARIDVVANDVSASTEDAAINFYVMTAGVLTQQFAVTSTGFALVSPVTVTSIDAGATGATLNLVHDSASPAISDEIGLISFKGNDDGGAVSIYAELAGLILDPSAGAEFGLIGFRIADGTGSTSLAASIRHDGSFGYIVAGDGVGSGKFVSNGDFDLVLQTGNATTGSITITDGANGDIEISPNGSGAVVIPAAAGIESATANVSVPFEYTAATEIIAEGAGGAISVATLVTTIGADGGGDAFTMAAGTIIGQKKKIIFVSTSGGTGVVTFAGRGAVNTLTFTAAGEYAEFIWDGTDWLDVELSSYGTFATPPVLSTV